MRLIDANALVKRLNETLRELEAILTRLKAGEQTKYIDETTVLSAINFAKIMKEVIEETPTVEERTKGEWINYLECRHHPVSFKEGKQCSACGYIDTEKVHNFFGHNFCPNCGADMRGERCRE